jgi:hypothetical protein
MRELNVLLVARSKRSTSPEVFEACRRQFGITHRVPNVAVAKVSLKRLGIVSLTCECVAAGVPQHVRVDLEAQLGCGTRPLDPPTVAASPSRLDDSLHSMALTRASSWGRPLPSPARLRVCRIPGSGTEVGPRAFSLPIPFQNQPVPLCGAFCLAFSDF